MRTPDAEAIATAVTFVAMLGAIAMIYRSQRCWERQARVWHERLKRPLLNHACNGLYIRGKFPVLFARRSPRTNEPMGFFQCL